MQFGVGHFNARKRHTLVASIAHEHAKAIDIKTIVFFALQRVRLRRQVARIAVETIDKKAETKKC